MVLAGEVAEYLGNLAISNGYMDLVLQDDPRRAR